MLHNKHCPLLLFLFVDNLPSFELHLKNISVCEQGVHILHNYNYFARKASPNCSVAKVL